VELHYCCGDNGRAYYVKGHVPTDEFVAALRKTLDADDPILSERAEHCWMRMCRDFQENHAVLVEAKPGKPSDWRG
jgi:hypothetical protein